MEARPNYDSSRILARKIYKICPKCKGKGYFEEGQATNKQFIQYSTHNNLHASNRDKRRNKKCSKSETSCRGDGVEEDDCLVDVADELTDRSFALKSSPTLPLLTSPTKVWHQAMSNRFKKNPLPDRFKLDKRWSFEKINSHTRPRSGTRSTTSKMKSFGSDTSINSDLSELLRMDRNLGDPKEALKQARLQIKSSNWVAIMAGLEDIAVLSGQSEDSSSSLDQCNGSSSMTGCSTVTGASSATGVSMYMDDSRLVDWDTVGLAMTKLVASFHLQKTRSVRMTCQILRELFRLMTTAVHRPQFDDAVNELMKRTADTSRMVRWDAQQALESMIIHVPVQFSTRAILNQAPRHKNPIVRQTAMRLVDSIVTMVTPKQLITHNQLKEPRKQIINVLCALIDDPNQHVRWLVRETIHNLMQNELFEDVLNADVEPQILKKADRSLILLQYSTEVE